MIRQIALEAEAEAEEEERLRRERMKITNKEYHRANLEQQKIKAQRAKMEALEDEKILEYASQKESLDAQRKAHEVAKYNAKQERYQKMMEKQSLHLMKLKEEEAKRVDLQIKEMKTKEDSILEEKKRRAEALKEKIRHSRELQIERKVDEMERQHVEDAIMTQEWARRAEIMNQLAREEELRTAEINIAHQTDLIQQMNERKVKEKVEKFKELEAARLHKNRLKKDDEVFENYAKECIEDFAVKGRTVVPMKLVLNKQEKRKTRLVVH